MTPFSWRRAIGFGLAVLRLSPDAFWRMTLRELACAIEAVAPPSPPPIKRTEFEDLMRAFPDR